MNRYNRLGKLSPFDPTAQAFVKLFPHRWDFIESLADPVKWHTVNLHYLESRTLWKRYCDPDILIGLRFGKNTSYGMYDLDIHSPYHPHQDERAFKNLLSVLEHHGLCKIIIVRSSDSHGLHIYVFFPEPLNSFQVACALKYMVMKAGYTVKGGTLETFPNTKTYVKNGKGFSNYNGHRLPLQEGSYLLDDDYQPYSNSVETFVRLAEDTAQQQDIESFKKLLPVAYQWFKQTKGKYIPRGNISHSAARWRGDVEDLIAEGWTGYGQTNEMLKEIGKYARVFLGLSDNDLWEKMLKIAQGCPGYETWCRHQQEIEKRCQDWAKIIEPYWTPLYSDPERQETYRQMMERGIRTAGQDVNRERHENATERIIAAVKHVLEEVEILPSRITQWIQALQEATKQLFNMTVSESTLRRPENLPYWHPKHRDWTEGREEITIPPNVTRGSDSGDLPPPPQTNQNSPKEEPNPDESRDEALTLTPEKIPQKTQPTPEQYATDIQQLELALGAHQEIYATPPLVTQPNNEKLGKIAPQNVSNENPLQSRTDGQHSDLRHTPPNEGLCVPDLSGGNLSAEEQVSTEPKVQEQPENIEPTQSPLKSSTSHNKSPNDETFIQPQEPPLEGQKTSSETTTDVTLEPSQEPVESRENKKYPSTPAPSSSKAKDTPSTPPIMEGFAPFPKETKIRALEKIFYVIIKD